MIVVENFKDVLLTHFITNHHFIKNLFCWTNTYFPLQMFV